MSRIKLTLACWNYDRTRALQDGTVAPEGIDLTYLSLPVEETFFRMLRYREFDVAEMSLSSYTVSLAAEHPAFIAIPAFVSRFFRHGSIFVSAKSGIAKPADLIGKRVGVARRLAYDELTSTAALKTMLPWQGAAAEETSQLMGPHWWPYDFAPN